MVELSSRGSWTWSEGSTTACCGRSIVLIAQVFVVLSGNVLSPLPGLLWPFPPGSLRLDLFEAVRRYP